MGMTEEEISKAVSGSDQDFAAALDRASEEDVKPAEAPKVAEEIPAPEVLPEENPKTEEPPEEENADAKPVEAVIPENETPEEKKAREHRERSAAGRLRKKEEEEQRLKRLEEAQARIDQGLQLLLQKAQAPAPAAAPVDDNPDVLLTRGEVEAEFERIQAKKEAEKKAKETELKKTYETGYIATLEGLKEIEDDPEVYSAVFAEITKIDSPFNRQHSWNAAADVAKNYKEAKTHILNSRPKPKENPLKGKAPEIPLGVSGATKVTAQVKPQVQLSPQAKSFVQDLERRTGKKMSQEEIEAVLQKK